MLYFAYLVGVAGSAAWVYRDAWGHFGEWIELYKQNHYPAYNRPS